MMEVEIFPPLHGPIPQAVPHRTCVVIDVFRASTTLLCLLEQGVQEIRVVESVEEALLLTKRGYRAVGERGEKPLKGFDLDNSPHGVMQRDWRNQKVAFTTTNGTRGLMALTDESEVIMAGFRNIDAAAGYLARTHRPVALFPMGNVGERRLEDDACAQALRSRILGLPVDWEEVLGKVRSSAARSIRFRGGTYQQDVDLSLEVNATSIVPVMDDRATLRAAPSQAG